MVAYGTNLNGWSHIAGGRRFNFSFPTSRDLPWQRFPRGKEDIRSIILFLDFHLKEGFMDSPNGTRTHVFHSPE